MGFLHCLLKAERKIGGIHGEIGHRDEDADAKGWNCTSTCCALDVVSSCKC